MTQNLSVLRHIENFALLAPYVNNKLIRGTPEIGKLGFKDEPAGKIRVFAMVDP
jgi:hypothetical protein